MSSTPLEDEQYVEDYLKSMVGLLPLLDVGQIAKVIAMFRDARDQKRTIFICGNGGSSSIASEMVVDIVKGASYQQEKRFRMMSLSDNIPTLTAYSNDVSYDDVFVEPLRNFAEPGDIVIGISGSGNSENVLRAIGYGNALGCKTIALTTGEGGKLKEVASLPLCVPSSHMGQLEDCFFILTHIVCYAFIDH